MSKLHLRKATAANKRLGVLQEQVTTLMAEKEDLLEKALVFAANPHDSILIYKMTGQKDLKTLAWSKAVLLLGSSPSSFEDLLLILECRHDYTQKEADIAQHLRIKREEILKNPTMEQVQQLYTKGNYEIAQMAKEFLRKMFDDCEDLAELQQWDELYGSENRKFVEPKTLWDSWHYNRAVKRLQPVAEDEEGSPE